MGGLVYLNDKPWRFALSESFIIVCHSSGVTDLSEELFNQLLSPAEMKVPRLGRMTDIG